VIVARIDCGLWLMVGIGMLSIAAPAR